MEDDLRALLRSPSLTLEPPSTLPAVVRRKARRHRMRTRAVGACTALAVIGVGVLLGPGLKDSIEGLRNSGDQRAEFKPDPRAPAATTDVVTMQRVNGAEVLTWFEGSRWCTATTRQTTNDACHGPVNPAHKGFSWVFPAGSISVTVDNAHVVAGLVPPGASRVVVHMKNGHEYAAAVVDGVHFVLPVWSARVDDRSSPVEYYVAYNSTGVEIDRKPA